MKKSTIKYHSQPICDETCNNKTLVITDYPVKIQQQKILLLFKKVCLYLKVLAGCIFLLCKLHWSAGHILPTPALNCTNYKKNCLIV